MEEFDSFKKGVKETFAQVTNDLVNIIENMKNDAQKQHMETNKRISSLQNKLDEVLSNPKATNVPKVSAQRSSGTAPPS